MPAVADVSCLLLFMMLFTQLAAIKWRQLVLQLRVGVLVSGRT